MEVSRRDAAPPRSIDRGPIEASALWLGREGRRPLRDQLIAAPLKPFACTLLGTSCGTLRDQLIAAPLKRTATGHPITATRALRDQLIAAPLKLF